MTGPEQRRILMLGLLRNGERRQTRKLRCLGARFLAEFTLSEIQRFFAQFILSGNSGTLRFAQNDSEGPRMTSEESRNDTYHEKVSRQPAQLAELAYGSMIRSRTAYRTRSLKDWNLSLCMMLLRWVSAVLTLMPRIAAVSLLLFPVARSCTTSRCRGVN